MYRSGGAALPGEDSGQGTGRAALAWGWGEDCELLHHSLLPNMVLFLALKKDYQIICERNTDHKQASRCEGGEEGRWGKQG